MYILLTDPLSRKTFDIANILKKKKYTLLIAYEGNIFIKLILKLLYMSKVSLLSLNNFDNDLEEIENLGEEVVFFPIEEKTILYYYNYLKVNPNSKIKHLLSNEDIFNLVRDKGTFSSFCLDNEINVPKEYSFEEALNITKVALPLIVKPKIGAGSVGIKFIDTIEDIKILNTLDSNTYIIQERIKNGQDILGGFFLTHHVFHF